MIKLMIKEIMIKLRHHDSSAIEDLQPQRQESKYAKRSEIYE